MKKFNLVIIALLFASLSCYAQDLNSFYATMDLADAKELKKDLPNEVEILAERRNEAAVYLTPNAGHILHERVLVHGPGYIYKRSKEDAIAAISKDVMPNSHTRMAFTISEDVLVNQTLDLINTQNIEDHILELVAYGTRYHTRATAIQAANDLKAKWEAMAAAYGRTDVSVRLFNHVNTNMPSVILTIEGAITPDEIVVVGGHLDSTAPGNNDAPGADDDASGIATITEATRALFEVGFVPDRTIEVMAYSAEEIGLVGSSEIADEYASNNINVVSVVQFDMTNYNGSANDVSFITDYTNGTLNAFLMQLVDHYNTSGVHEISYGTSLCNYGCSDHASWNDEGYMAAFPFEANFGQHNSNIHSANDTYAITGTADHAAKFAKLCVEFLIETAKSSVLSVDQSLANSIFVMVNNGEMIYNFEGVSEEFNAIEFYNMQGRKVLETNISSNHGSVQLTSFNSGIYIASFIGVDKSSVSKKIVVK